MSDAKCKTCRLTPICVYDSYGMFMYDCIYHQIKQQPCPDCEGLYPIICEKHKKDKCPECNGEGGKDESCKKCKGTGTKEAL